MINLLYICLLYIIMIGNNNTNSTVRVIAYDSITQFTKFTI